MKKWELGAIVQFCEETWVKSGIFALSANLVRNETYLAQQFLGNVIVKEDVWDNPTGQQVYFEFLNVNHSWGYTYSGFIVAGNGQILAYNRLTPQNSIPYESTPQGPVNGNKFIGIPYQNQRVIGYVGAANMKKYTQMIRAIDDNNYVNPKFFTDPGFDYGEDSLRAYDYDTSTNTYKVKNISSYDGMHLGINCSTEAGILAYWLHHDVFRGTRSFGLDLEKELATYKKNKAQWESYTGPYTITYQETIAGGNVITRQTRNILGETTYLNGRFQSMPLTVNHVFEQVLLSLKNWGVHSELAYSKEYGYPTLLQISEDSPQFFQPDFSILKKIESTDFRLNEIKLTTDSHRPNEDYKIMLDNHSQALGNWFTLWYNSTAISLKYRVTINDQVTTYTLNKMNSPESLEIVPANGEMSEWVFHDHIISALDQKLSGQSVNLNATYSENYGYPIYIKFNFVRTDSLEPGFEIVELLDSSLEKF